MKYYTIYDTVADEYQNLFPSQNDKTAIRSYLRWLQSNQHVADDYKLYYGCEMSLTGDIRSIAVPLREVDIP